MILILSIDTVSYCLFEKKTDNNKMTNVVFIADDVLDFILTK